MLFNSIEFVIFFPVVLLLYWRLFNKFSVNLRNAFLLATSYLFYGWWDYRFLGLVILSSVVDFWCGAKIFQAQTKRKKRRFLILSLSVNLGVLFFFKYFGFFSRELIALFANWGYPIHPATLNIILPVGISFYTFQTLSYTIDIYRERLKPTNDWLAFFSFVAFFPQLVAGPIERAKHLLPQFYSKKIFDYLLAANGFRQVLWGFFAKIAVADSVAPIVDTIFAQYETANAATLAMGAFLFSIQIFGDFAGYSNIAIGLAAMLGFNLMQNFATPYFSRNIREFWSRWHISLSTWFRDYVYIPLGGNRRSPLRHSINIMATFVLSGLWHGANWTFIIWGTIHGLFYLVTQPFSTKTRSDEIRLNQVLPIIGTFVLVTFAFIFFRAENIVQAGGIISRIGGLATGNSIFQMMSFSKIIPALFFSVILIVTEWLQKNRQHGLDITFVKPAVRHAIYYFIIFAILFSFQTNRVFIYFQF
ncbi:D-alanyl-lipoteichoic acid acyltransferase DltB, MBOAT superfamily [Mariniphaga anaerophila]|uniref:D-alanyl-lipoteichoic acid acyltransferase DltB, MBOAT superfamily n=1 Tax=Mariniphaga anaerophila TaxID=1484053 RepID=A0A1M5FG88_9BACT|nr:MBOAT family O-acyltransferase [Mariniphaga anaerophila]SHF90506.1 D-alanyl-lipoteichoic acid acyltransferase DltB, MBOAT superfamily [Mariniphaga anaerophila]